MPTLYLFRLILVCPVGAKLTGVVNWLAANIDPSVAPDLGPGLSATGSEPATHHWCCWAITNLQAREIVKRLCALAAITPPTNAQWTAWTRAERIGFLVGVRSAIWAGYGIWATLADNEGTWDDPEVQLVATGLQRLNELP